MDFNLAGKIVHIGIPAYRPLEPQTAAALCATTLALAKEGIGFGLSIKSKCCYVDMARCIIAHEFLMSPAEYFFQIDSDMAWEPADFLRVLAHATIMDSVSVPYRMKDETEKYTVCIPDPAVANEFGCIPMLGGGLGFCCTQRKVIEALAKKAERVRMGEVADVSWMFRCRSREGNFQGEDMVFFEDMRELGFAPYLDLQPIIGHLGMKDYRGSLAESLKGGGDSLQGWTFPADVPGWLSENEGATLARLSAKKDVLEIGSFQGRSTVAMAQLANKVVSIDTHKGDRFTGTADTLDTFLKVLSYYGVREKVEVNVGSVKEVSAKLRDHSFDLVFVDGNHDAESARFDIGVAQMVVKPGGIIAVHDIDMLPVKAATHDLLGDKYLGLTDKLMWFQVP